MTSLVFSTFDIPQAAVTITTSVSEDTDYPSNNLIGGPRSAYFKFGSAGTARSIVYDLGPSVTKAIDHVCLARADILAALGVTSIVYAGSSDNLTYTTVATVSSLSTRYGPRSDDYLTELSTSTAYRYWKTTYNGSSSVFTHSKSSFGSFMDLGQPVEEFTCERLPAKEVDFFGDAGAAQMARIEEPLYRMVYTWTGVTTANLNAFTYYVARWAHKNPIFLYTKSTEAQHYLLDYQRVIHARLLDWSASPQKDSDYWYLKTEWEEVLG